MRIQKTFVDRRTGKAIPAEYVLELKPNMSRQEALKQQRLEERLIRKHGVLTISM
jgi:hypothetical protein